MIGRSKEEKSTHSAAILGFLWEGKTAEALDYLRNRVAVRNVDKHQELIGYLEKHQNEIIDYKRRQAAGKSIGSGRMEKAVDQVIGHRQQRKGMSWRPEGSRALALLKVLELNGGWQDFWFPKAASESTDFGEVETIHLRTPPTLILQPPRHILHRLIQIAIEPLIIPFTLSHQTPKRLRVVHIPRMTQLMHHHIMHQRSW